MQKPLFEKSGAKTFLNLGLGRWICQRPWPRFVKSLFASRPAAAFSSEQFLITEEMIEPGIPEIVWYDINENKAQSDN